eukprot:scaffold85857_cov51-Phaeocystis_antarctica.AAC.1
MSSGSMPRSRSWRRRSSAVAKAFVRGGCGGAKEICRKRPIRVPPPYVRHGCGTLWPHMSTQRRRPTGVSAPPLPRRPRPRHPRPGAGVPRPRTLSKARLKRVRSRAGLPGVC